MSSQSSRSHRENSDRLEYRRTPVDRAVEGVVHYDEQIPKLEKEPRSRWFARDLVAAYKEWLKYADVLLQSEDVPPDIKTRLAEEHVSYEKKLSELEIVKDTGEKFNELVQTYREELDDISMLLQDEGENMDQEQRAELEKKIEGYHKKLADLYRRNPTLSAAYHALSSDRFAVIDLSVNNTSSIVREFAAELVMAVQNGDGDGLCHKIQEICDLITIRLGRGVVDLQGIGALNLEYNKSGIKKTKYAHHDNVISYKGKELIHFSMDVDGDNSEMFENAEDLQKLLAPLVQDLLENNLTLQEEAIS